MRVLLIITTFVLSSAWVVGQTGINPFDITERIDSSYVPSASTTENVFDVEREDFSPSIPAEPIATPAATKGEPSAPTPVAETPQDRLLGANPFEVSHIPIRTSQLREKADAFSQESSSSEAPKGQAPASTTFVFWLSLLAGVLLAIVINIRRTTIVRLAKSLLNENILKSNYREERHGLSGYYLLLYTIYFITASIFMYLLVIRFEVPKGFQTYLMCFGAVVAAYLTKHIILRVIGLTYPVAKESSLYSFTIETFNIFIGLVLLPLNLIIAFGPIEFSQIFLYITLGVLLILLLLRSFRGLLISTSYLQKHIFHFFLYLCAVEMVPLLLLTKIVI